MNTSTPSVERPPSCSRPDLTALLLPMLPMLRRFALKLTRNPDDSQDLLQDVLLKAVEQGQRINEVHALRAWMVRVMYHQFIDLRRRTLPMRNSVSLSDCNPLEHMDGVGGGWELTAEDEAAEQQLERWQLMSVVHEAINRLPDAQRDAVNLHDIQGMTVPSIAMKLDVSANTVKSSLARARIGLRRRLEVLRDPPKQPSKRQRRTHAAVRPTLKTWAAAG